MSQHAKLIIRIGRTLGALGLCAALALILGEQPDAHAQTGITYTVTTTADSGAGSLRQAITDANANPGKDTIAFNIPGAGPHTIAPLTPLPAITDPLLLDGCSQPGADCSQWPPTLKIEIDGALITSGLYPGLEIRDDSSEIRGLALRNHGHAAIWINAADQTWVHTNFLGTDITGTLGSTRDTGIGVLIDGNSQYNIIGTDADGLNDEAERNLISGNPFMGVMIGSVLPAQPRPSYNTVAGNFIGTNVSGVSALGNGQQGVVISESNNNQIGATLSGKGNVIAYNNGIGITVVPSAADVNNAIQGNNVYDNGGLGIDLGGDGPTLNDPGDADTGPNTLQNFPVLTTATTRNVGGTLNSAPNANYTLEFFSSPTCDPSGYGEGETFQPVVQRATIWTGTGNLSFTFTFVNAIPVGHVITAIAIDTLGGNTSEFSACSAPVPAPTAGPYTVTTTADSGPGSLRQALLDANAYPGADSITFNIPGAGPYTIMPLTPLPAITDPLLLDGCSQPGADCSQWPLVLKIEIDGSNHSGDHALVFTGSSSTLRGIVLNHRSVRLASSYNVIESNFIGSNVAGTVQESGGVSIDNGGQYNRIGTNGDGVNDEAERNLIVGHTQDSHHPIDSGDFAISIYGPGTDYNVIAGNYIGTDVTGTVKLNQDYGGIHISGGAQHNLIGTNGDGTADEAERNVIVFNTWNVYYNYGITIAGTGTDHNVVAGNYIGTDPTGTAALDYSYAGVFITLGAQYNILGTDGDGIADEAERNIIAGCGHSFAISSQAEHNVVAGNYIGVDVTGTTVIGEANYGVNLEADNNRIGTNGDGISDDLERNIIVADLSYCALEMRGSNNVIAGNHIGTNASGTNPPVGSDTRCGIKMYTGSNNVIGGTTSGTANLIAFSSGPGIFVGKNAGTGNTFLHNIIHSSGGLGIDISLIYDSPYIPDGPTLNDPGDADTGPNNLQNYPVLTAATGTTVSGTLNSTPNATFTLEFFSNTTCDPSGYGEGETFQPTTQPATVTTNASGNGTFSFTFASVIPGAPFITATATDPAGNTSEFSQCIQVIVSNLPPVNTVPGAQSMARNTTLVFGASRAISISDPDAGSNPVQVTLSVTQGALTLSATAGLTFTTGDGTADAAMIFTGTIAAINAALDGLTYTPPDGFMGSVTLTITTNDQGYTGTGGPQIDTDTVAIQVGPPPAGCYPVPDHPGAALCTSD